MSIDERERRAWAYLVRAAEPPCAALIRLIEQIGPIDAAKAVSSQDFPAGHTAVRRATAARVDNARTSSGFDAVGAADLEAADRLGGRLVTPADDEWPGYSLLATAQADTADRGGPPLALWLRGPLRLDDVAAASIAMVGSRAASAYGEAVTTSVTEELVGMGWAITSGAAFGIDGSAHRAALASDGATMAVLACGVDRPYPSAHARLLEDIAVRGLVVSEYPLGEVAGRHRFLTRNRLVAALSSAVIIVEAGVRSGAINTAGWAHKFARPLGAIPGPVTSATSVGCHDLIVDGRATLVADAAAVAALARPDGTGRLERGPDRPTDDLTDDQQRVHDALPGRGVVTMEEIAYTSALAVSTVRKALAIMEIRGLVALDGDGWRLARSRR